jgi:hypothetical protein
MDEFSDIWIDQCVAARGIRDAWDSRKALDICHDRMGCPALEYDRWS